MGKWDKYLVTEEAPSAASKWDKYAVSDSPQPVANPVQAPSLFNEFLKANQQLASGARANLQGRSFQSGFENPNSVPRFAETMSQGVMNTLEKSKFMREHPTMEALAYNSIGKPAGLLGATVDTFTNPMDVVGTIVGGRLIGPVANKAFEAEQAFRGFLSNTGRGISNRLGMNYPERLATLKAQQESIASTASREIGATEAQIKYNIGNLEQSKAQQLSNMTSLTKEAEALNAKAISEQEAMKTSLGIKLPDVAYSSGQKLKDRFISVIRKHSDMYSQKLNSLLGGKNSSINIDTNSVTSAIEDTLLSRGVPTVIDDTGKITIDSAASPAERRLINLYNKLQGQSSVNLRDVIRNKQMLGRSVGYGSKGYNYDDDLLNDAVQRLGSRIEKELPGIKPLNQETSKFLRIKDEANMRLDLFKQGSTKPREFVEKFATSGMNPEERVFLSKLRTELPDFDRLAKAPRALGEGMKKYEEAIQMLKNGDPKIQQKVVADFDTEIAKLRSNQDIIKARIANEAEAKSKPITSEIDRIEKKIAKLKKIKDTIVTIGSTGALGYGAVRALNYGYNALFKDT